MILIIILTSFTASLLTFFSGFGLGTLLFAVYATFFPINVAIAATAGVHLLNNLFKIFLVRRHADYSLVWKMGITAIPAAFLGAFMLLRLSEGPSIFRYDFFGKICEVTPLHLGIGAVLILLVRLESHLPSLDLRWTQSPILGGALSGFFGGLSGQQGAFRTVILLRAGLSAKSFIATGVVLSILIDITRILVYGSQRFFEANVSMVIPAVGGAFVGSYLGSRWIEKVTLPGLQKGIQLALIAFALLLMAGIL